MSLEHVVLKARFPDKQLTVVLEDFKKAINHLVDVENTRNPRIATAHDVIVQSTDCYWKPSDNATDIYRPTGYVTIGGESQKTDKLRVYGGLGLYDTAAAPCLTLTNASDTARDPLIKFAVGASPTIKYVMGIDDSDSDSFVIAATTSITGNDFIKYADGTLTLSDSSAAPVIKLSNASATERDPVLQFAVGATPVVKYTMGVDDSEDKWKLATGSEFGSDHDVMVLTTGDAITPPVAEFTLSNTWQTPVSGTAETPSGVCTDGEYLYYVVPGSDALVKIDPVAGTETARVNMQNETVANMNAKQVVCDGTHLYIQNAVSWTGISKHNCSDLAFVAASPDQGGGSRYGHCYWGGHLYYLSWNALSDVTTIGKTRCSDMAAVSTVDYAAGNGAGQMHRGNGIATDGAYLYVLDCGGGWDGAAPVNNRIVRLLMDGTWVDAVDLENAINNANTWDTCAIWIYEQYIYVGTRDGYIDKYLKSDSSFIERFLILATNTPQAFCLDGFHYAASADDTCIYQYTSSPTITAGVGGLQIRLRDQYGQMVDVAKFTGDVRFGVGTTIPSETIEAVGNIKATGGQFISTKATGTAPVVVSSTTVCPNLNAGLLDGYHATTFLSPKYIVQEANADLSAEQSLGALATGILKNTTAGSTGVLSIATGADLPAHVLDGAVHTVSGLTSGHFLKATGATTFAFGAHGLTASSVGAEPALGNPGTTGFVLSSTDAGVRSWVAAGGAMALDDLSDVDAASPGDHDIIQYHTGLGWVHGSLPAAPSALDDLTDVNAPAPADQNVLTWDAASGKWIPQVAPAGGGGTGTSLEFFNPDSFPESPTAQSDHFDDDTVTGWTEFNPGSYTQSIAEADHHLKITRATNAGENWSGYFKALPAGDFTITAKLAFTINATPGGYYCGVALALFQDATNNPSTSDFIVHGVRRHGTNQRNIVTNRWSGYASWAVNYYQGSASYNDAFESVYVWIRRNGTTLYFDYCYDGISWMRCYTVAQYFAPAEFGFLVYNYGTGVSGVAWVDWVYYEGADNFNPPGRVITIGGASIIEIQVFGG